MSVPNLFLRLVKKNALYSYSCVNCKSRWMSLIPLLVGSRSVCPVGTEPHYSLKCVSMIFMFLPFVILRVIGYILWCKFSRNYVLDG